MSQCDILWTIQSNAHAPLCFWSKILANRAINITRKISDQEKLEILNIMLHLMNCLVNMCIGRVFMYLIFTYLIWCETIFNYFDTIMSFFLSSHVNFVYVTKSMSSFQKFTMSPFFLTIHPYLIIWFSLKSITTWIF